MQINLKEYNKVKSLEFSDIKFRIKACDFEIINNEDLNFIDDIIVTGKISISNDILKVNFNILAKFEFICSRCMNKFVYDLNLICDDEFLLDNLDEDITLDSEQNLDFSDYIKNYIIVNIPQKKLCKVDCLGLCQSCGLNLNDEACDCNNNQRENVFWKLKEMF